MSMTNRESITKLIWKVFQHLFLTCFNALYFTDISNFFFYKISTFNFSERKSKKYHNHIIWKETALESFLLQQIHCCHTLFHYKCITSVFFSIQNPVHNKHRIFANTTLTNILKKRTSLGKKNQNKPNNNNNGKLHGWNKNHHHFHHHRR